jgi:hypothetical protein
LPTSSDGIQTHFSIFSSPPYLHRLWPISYGHTSMCVYLIFAISADAISELFFQFYFHLQRPAITSSYDHPMRDCSRPIRCRRCHRTAGRRGQGKAS